MSLTVQLPGLIVAHVPFSFVQSVGYMGVSLSLSLSLILGGALINDRCVSSTFAVFA